MNLTIIGSGYVGLVTGACLADIGHDVFCLDVDSKKIDILNNGGVPIHEPGLGEIIARNRAAGRLQFSTDVEAAVAHGDVQFIAVGTPPDEDGSADLQYVLAAARNIGRHMNGFKVIVDKSTVPVGTAERVRAAVADELKARGEDSMFSVVSNPEFLKEGAAVEDFTRPDRIVIGCDDDVPGERARELMKKLYAPFNRNHERTLYMDVRSAEFTKYAANAMLATRISFMNELANLAERFGADIEAVRRGIGSDPRIGYHFLYAAAAACFSHTRPIRAVQRQADAVAGVPRLRRHRLPRRRVRRGALFLSRLQVDPRLGFPARCLRLVTPSRHARSSSSFPPQRAPRASRRRRRIPPRGRARARETENEPARRPAGSFRNAHHGRRRRARDARTRHQSKRPQ
ncbi:hypothetical protein GTC050_55060 [Burkholderia pseudomallei]|nr:hypothetical protein GTC050_55060 [Burkholderia pseudomallei]